MEKITCKISSLSPFLMHNGHMANPMNPLTVSMKELTSKRKKTDEDIIKISQLEWVAGLYLSQPVKVDIGNSVKVLQAGKIVVSSEMLYSALKAGARKYKLGKQYESGVIIEEKDNLLKYKGSDDLNVLIKDENFIDRRMVVIQRNRILRTRPIFMEWSTEFTILYTPEIFNKKDIPTIIEKTGNEVGIGDYRPRYGRFQIDYIK